MSNAWRDPSTGSSRILFANTTWVIRASCENWDVYRDRSETPGQSSVGIYVLDKIICQSFVLLTM
jgi:hypothetical protein